MRLNTIAKPAILVLILIISLSSAFAVTKPSCVTDRTCCANVVGSINTLCWVNQTFGTNSFDIYSFWNYDPGARTYARLLDHSNYFAEWDLDNHDGTTTTNSKSGLFYLPNFRTYGNAIAGPVNTNGGVNDPYCNAWKCMVANTYTGVEVEAEGFVWNHSYVGWTVAKTTTANFTITWTIPTTNVSVVDESAFSCENCYIIEVNKSFSATNYDPSLKTTFYLAVHPKPNVTGGVGTSTSATMTWLSGGTYNITYVVARKPYHADLARWMNNVSAYQLLEEEVINTTEKFFSAFNYPWNQTEVNKTDYYNGVLSFWRNGYPCINDTDTNLKPYLSDKGRCAVMNIPGRWTTGNYRAMWIWDSFNTGFGIISALNYSHPNTPWVLNITIDDWLRVWIKNVDKYPTVNYWPVTINQATLGTGTQAHGGWDLLVLNYWNVSQTYNFGLITQSYLCGDVINGLRSFQESRQTVDGILSQGAKTMGRDGTSVIQNSANNGDATFWHIMASISEANIYAICGNDTEKNATLADFDLSRYGYDTEFWNSSCNGGKGCYWNRDTSGDFLVLNDSNTDIAGSPLTQAMILPFGNMTNSRREYILTDLLRHNFTDPTAPNGGMPYTSIPYLHVCYDSEGTTGTYGPATCQDGETWDGPIWMGVDNFFILNIMRDLRNRLNMTNLSTEEKWLGDNMLYWVGLYNETGGLGGTSTGATPYMVESYSAATRDLPGEWGINPYGWGGNIPTTVLNNYNIFKVLSFDPSSAASDAPEPEGDVPYYNKTHPMLFKNNAAAILTNVNVSGAYQARYTQLLTDSNSFANWTSYNNTIALTYFRAYRMSTEALRFYLTNDSASLADAISGLSGYLNYTIAEYATITVHNRAEIFSNIPIVFDYVFNNLTDTEKEVFIGRIYNLSTYFYDNDLPAYDDDVSNDNGHGLRGGICMMMMAIKGQHPTDGNFTSGNRWEGCLNMAETWFRGYLGGFSEPDGFPDYVEYGQNHLIPWLETIDKNENTSFLEKYNQSLCGTGRSWLYYMLDTKDGKFGTSDRLRKMAYGDAEYYHGMYPHILQFYASECNDPYLNWLTLYQFNYTDDYSTTASRIPLDLVFFNASIGVTSPSALPLTWNDSAWDRVIWRDGWTFDTDLVFGYGGWAVQSAGHSHQDDTNFFLFKKYPLLVEGGDRTDIGTDAEVPAGTFFHNVLTVDFKGNMSWSGDEGSTTPSTLHYAGIDVYPQRTDCPIESYTNCSYMSYDYKMRISELTVSDTYNTILSSKPYYTLENNTRRIVWLKDLSEDVFIFKDTVTAASAHNYSFGFNTDSVNLTASGVNFTANINDSNVLAQVLYNSTSCGWQTNFSQFTRNANNVSMVLNRLNCSQSENVTIITAVYPYLNADAKAMRFKTFENTTNIMVNVSNGTEDYIVSFGKDNKDNTVRILDSYAESQFSSIQVSLSCSVLSNESLRLNWTCVGNCSYFELFNYTATDRTTLINNTDSEYNHTSLLAGTTYYYNLTGRWNSSAYNSSVTSCQTLANNATGSNATTTDYKVEICRNIESGFSNFGLQLPALGTMIGIGFLLLIIGGIAMYFYGEYMGESFAPDISFDIGITPGGSKQVLSKDNLIKSILTVFIVVITVACGSVIISALLGC